MWLKILWVLWKHITCIFIITIKLLCLTNILNTLVYCDLVLGSLNHRNTSEKPPDMDIASKRHGAGPLYMQLFWNNQTESEMSVGYTTVIQVNDNSWCWTLVAKETSSSVPTPQLSSVILLSRFVSFGDQLWDNPTWHVQRHTSIFKNIFTNPVLVDINVNEICTYLRYNDYAIPVVFLINVLKSTNLNHALFHT